MGKRGRRREHLHAGGREVGLAGGVAVSFGTVGDLGAQLGLKEGGASLGGHAAASVTLAHLPSEHAIRVVIRGHQRSSEVIRGHQRSSADLKREAQACKRAVAGDAGHKQPAAPIVPPDEALAAHLMREPIRGTRRSSKAPNRHRRLQRALKRHPDPSSCAYGVIGLVDGAIDKQRGNDASVRQRETRVVERDIGEHE